MLILLIFIIGLFIFDANCQLGCVKCFVLMRIYGFYCVHVLDMGSHLIPLIKSRTFDG